MSTYRIECEVTEITDYKTRWKTEYKELNTDEDAHDLAYTLADKGYYRIYKKVDNNSLKKYHWEKIT